MLRAALADASAEEPSVPEDAALTALPGRHPRSALALGLARLVRGGSCKDRKEQRLRNGLWTQKSETTWVCSTAEVQAQVNTHKSTVCVLTATKGVRTAPSTVASPVTGTARKRKSK